MIEIKHFNPFLILNNAFIVHEVVFIIGIYLHRRGDDQIEFLQFPFVAGPGYKVTVEQIDVRTINVIVFPVGYFMVDVPRRI